ncbi:hypothetical protein [Nocardiopsis flavescens]
MTALPVEAVVLDTDADAQRRHQGDVHVHGGTVALGMAQQHQGDVHVHGGTVTFGEPPPWREYSGATPDAPGHDLAPDPLAARTAADLMELLREFRIWCGEPSYRQMSARCEGAYSPSSFCMAINKQTLPTQQMLIALVIVCSGKEAAIRPWLTAWRRIKLHSRRQRAV